MKFSVVGTRAMVVVVLAAGLLGSASGCSVERRKYATPLDPTAPEPGTDAAMRYRNFEPTTATYENIGVVAWYTRAPLVLKAGTPDWKRVYLEPLLFLGNVGVSPVSFALHPPFGDQVVYRTGGLPPTYSGAAPFDSVVQSDIGPVLPGLPRPSQWFREPRKPVPFDAHLSDEQLANAVYPDVSKLEQAGPPTVPAEGAAVTTEPVTKEPAPVTTEPAPVTTEPGPVTTEPSGAKVGGVPAVAPALPAVAPALEERPPVGTDVREKSLPVPADRSPLAPSVQVENIAPSPVERPAEPGK